MQRNAVTRPNPTPCALPRPLNTRPSTRDPSPWVTNVALFNPDKRRQLLARTLTAVAGLQSKPAWLRCTPLGSTSASDKFP